jgi:NitT/TauT family transport system substrate-binding protein
MKKFFLSLMVALAVISSAVVVCHSKEMKEVRLNMGHPKWHFYGPYLLGIKQGYFAEEGINLKLVPSNGSSEAIQMVALGSDNFADIPSGPIIIGKAAGMPVKVVASVVDSIYSGSLFFNKKLGIKTPEDLKGRKIRVAYDPRSATWPALRAFFRKQKIDMSQVVLVSGQSDNLIILFLKGSVDAYVGHLITEKDKLFGSEMEGKWGHFFFYDYGINIPSPMVVTNEEFLKKNPRIVRGFVKAALKSWKYSKENPEYAVKALVKAYPELDYERELKRFQTLLSLSFVPSRPGYLDEKEWNEVIRMFLDGGLISEGFNARELVTNDFLPSKEK